MKEEIVPTSGSHAEVITGGIIKTGTLADFHQAVYGKPLPEDGRRPAGLKLAVEKFRTPGDKHYRLIWTAKGTAWLAAEDTTHYSTRHAALLLAGILGVRMGVVVDSRKR